MRSAASRGTEKLIRTVATRRSHQDGRASASSQGMGRSASWTGGVHSGGFGSDMGGSKGIPSSLSALPEILRLESQLFRAAEEGGGGQARDSRGALLTGHLAAGGAEEPLQVDAVLVLPGGDALGAAPRVLRKGAGRQAQVRAGREIGRAHV